MRVPKKAAIVIFQIIAFLNSSIAKYINIVSHNVYIMHPNDTPNHMQEHKSMYKKRLVLKLMNYKIKKTACNIAVHPLYMCMVTFVHIIFCPK